MLILAIILINLLTGKKRDEEKRRRIPIKERGMEKSASKTDRYAGSIAANLTVSQLTPQPISLLDLSQKNVSVVRGSYAAGLAQQVDAQVFSSLSPLLFLPTYLVI